jgi:Protein of unknown function (DUF3277)
MKTYSFLNTVVLVNGVEIQGWADGDDAISIKPNEDMASHKVGASGDMMVSISADRSGEFTFKLLQTSNSNSYLLSLSQNQQLGGSSFYPLAVKFQDVHRQDMADGTSGYLKRLPDLTRGEEGATQEWTIVVERLDLVMGANL